MSSRYLFIGLLIILSGAATLRAAEPAVAILLDELILQGTIDADSDQEALWLRRETAGIRLKSRIPWSQVRELQVADKRYQPDIARALLAKLIAPQIAEHDLPPYPASIDMLPAHTPLPAIDLRPVSLQIEAQPANWDHDAETDGLEVLIQPLNAAGILVPVNGMLSLTLTVQRDNLNGGKVGRTLPEFIRLETAHHRVTKKDFVTGPAVFRLPYTSVHPEQCVDWSPLALVQAELGISGVGTLQAGAADVCIRPVSYFRDSLQYLTGARSLRGEFFGRFP